MAKSRNQKGKILVLEHLLMGTSESQIVTMQEILDKLMEYGITAERKSIYDDLDALREFGLDVQYKRGRPGGYYLAGGSTNNVEHVSSKPVKESNQKAAKEYAPTVINVESVLSEDEIQDKEKEMKLQCSGAREQEIRVYFGSHAEYKLKDSGVLNVTAPLTAGPKFFGWLTMMGKDVHIVKPKKVAAAYRDYLKTIVKEYKGI